MTSIPTGVIPKQLKSETPVNRAHGNWYMLYQQLSETKNDKNHHRFSINSLTLVTRTAFFAAYMDFVGINGYGSRITTIAPAVDANVTILSQSPWK